jgi:acetyltransferase
LARRVLEQTRIHHALKGTRGRKPVDLAALEQLVVRFSQLVVEQPRIAEIDINPLLASAEGLLALDARILLHGPALSDDKLPTPAIRPYPSQYVKALRLHDGTSVTLRPIRPEDEPLMVKFHKTLSEESVYYRYFTPLKLPQRTAHERLTRICFNDYDREIALVVEHKATRNADSEILGVGRLVKGHGVNEGEFALVVSDKWHRHGLGTELLTTLVEIGRNEKLDRIVGYVLPENHAMQNVARKAGFTLSYDAEGSQWEAEILLP